MFKVKKTIVEYEGEKELTDFYQNDAFTNPDCFDDFITPDKDGICIMGGCTQEPMTGIYSVRVLITKGREKDISKIVLSLRKIAEYIERDGKIDFSLQPHLNKRILSVKEEELPKRDDDEDGASPF